MVARQLGYICGIFTIRRVDDSDTWDVWMLLKLVDCSKIRIWFEMESHDSGKSVFSRLGETTADGRNLLDLRQLNDLQPEVLTIASTISMLS